jgi:hypothetical protein
MYVKPNDPTVRKAQEARKRIHDANVAAVKASNVSRMAQVAKSTTPKEK